MAHHYDTRSDRACVVCTSTRDPHDSHSNAMAAGPRAVIIIVVSSWQNRQMGVAIRLSSGRSRLSLM